MSPIQQALLQPVNNSLFNKASGAINPFASGQPQSPVPMTAWQTQQLPQGVQSPIAQQQVVPHFVGELAKFNTDLPYPDPNIFQLAAQGLGEQFGWLKPAVPKIATTATNNAAAQYQAPTRQVLQPQTLTPTPYINQPLDKLASQIHAGFTNYGNPPVATVSAALAQAGQHMPDPLLPAVIALKESSGGKNTTYQNNYLNLGHWGYPDMTGAAIGGGGHVGIMQQLTDPKYNSAYRDYIKSGDLKDFFKVYTPPGAEGNASIPDQIKQYNQLRNYFTNKDNKG